MMTRVPLVECRSEIQAPSDIGAMQAWVLETVREESDRRIASAAL